MMIVRADRCYPIRTIVSGNFYRDDQHMIPVRFYILREATEEEWRAYRRAEGWSLAKTWPVSEGEWFYEVSTD